MAPRSRNGSPPPRPDAASCARLILEAVPPAMWFLRREIRLEAGSGISLPQLRVLAFLRRSPGASLSAVADYAGVTDATASASVDRLVQRGLVSREGHPSERRRVVLDLTAEGSALLERARSKAGRSVAARLQALSPEEVSALSAGLELLQRALGAPFDKGGPG